MSCVQVSVTTTKKEGLQNGDLTSSFRNESLGGVMKRRLALLIRGNICIWRMDQLVSEANNELKQLFMTFLLISIA